MDKKIKKSIAVAAGFVLIVIIIWAVASSLHHKTKQNQASLSSVKSGQKEEAPKGQIISGFPASFILNKADLSDSYKIPYLDRKNNVSNQYSVSFFSSKNVADEYTAYVDYLEQNNFQIKNKNLSANNMASVYATNGSSDFQASIYKDQSGKTEVVASYLVR